MIHPAANVLEALVTLCHHVEYAIDHLYNGMLAHIEWTNLIYLITRHIVCGGRAQLN